MYFHLIVTCVLIMGTVQIVTLFKAVLYARFLYPYMYKPRFLQGTEFPTVHLFVPCKGRSERIEQVIEAFATQDYPASYRVTFVTESEEDGAVPLLREATKRHAHLRHKVAGLAKTCGQKNHNLLVAMEDDHESDVFAFADADVLTEAHWLRSLMQPLTLGPRYVTTGLPSGRISDNTYTQGMEAAYTTFQARYVMAITALWGGTFAIWRETLEKIEGTSTWSSTVVDDIALYERIEIFNQKASSHEQLLVYPLPDLPADIPTRMPALSNLINWFTRQILFMRYHRRLVWQVAVLGNLIQATLIVLGPTLLLFGTSAVAQRAGWICVFFYWYVVLTNIAQALIRRSSDFFNWTWIKGCLVGDLVAALCLVRSVYAKDLQWAGIRYTFDRRGHVAQVFHPSKEAAPSTSALSSSQPSKH